MPEIMSAEELSQVMEDCISFDGDEFCGYNSKQCRNAIRSRDSAMLEKYKEAIEKILKDHCMYPGKIDIITSALDSVLAEINQK